MANLVLQTTVVTVFLKPEQVGHLFYTVVISRFAARLLGGRGFLAVLLRTGKLKGIG